MPKFRSIKVRVGTLTEAREVISVLEEDGCRLFSTYLPSDTYGLAVTNDGCIFFTDALAFYCALQKEVPVQQILGREEKEKENTTFKYAHILQAIMDKGKDVKIQWADTGQGNWQDEESLTSVFESLSILVNPESDSGIEIRLKPDELLLTNWARPYINHAGKIDIYVADVELCIHDPSIAWCGSGLKMVYEVCPKSGSILNLTTEPYPPQ